MGRSVRILPVLLMAPLLAVSLRANEVRGF
jgi:hypothetical protein